ncbi:hypothetical protein CERSUDRAFT_59675, partial [Gelatoporia subvermispora B]
SLLQWTTTTAKAFREGFHDISLISYSCIEANRDLEEEIFSGGRSPVPGSSPGSGLPILRAGLGMTDALLSLFPVAPVYHLGIYREKISLQPAEHYSKLPPVPMVDMVFLLYLLIATGGTTCAVLNMVHEWGIPLAHIKLLCVPASQEGLDRVHSDTRGWRLLKIWAAAVDSKLTSNGLISPGLGDTVSADPRRYLNSFLRISRERAFNLGDDGAESVAVDDTGLQLPEELLLRHRLLRACMELVQDVALEQVLIGHADLHGLTRWAVLEVPVLDERNVLSTAYTS